MSENNVSPVTSETQTCASSCNHRRSGLLRAVLYAPIVLIAGGMASMAMFPGLSEYATPLIGDSAGSECSCPLTRLAKMVGFNSRSEQTCSSQGASAGSCSASVNEMSAGSCPSQSMSSGTCCPSTGSCPAAAETNSSAEAVPSLDSASTNELPADAFAAINSVDLETPSN